VASWSSPRAGRHAVGDITVPAKLRIRPRPGVRVIKMPGIREWLLVKEDEQGRNCLLDPDAIQDAAFDRLLSLVPQDGYNHGEGEFWDFVQIEDD
jgi:hypothetical protein